VPANNIDILSELIGIQEMFIAGEAATVIFDHVLEVLLKATESAYGFVGSILQADDGRPYLKTHAITNISWDDESEKFYSENAPQGLEFRNLESLFGYTIKTGEMVLTNAPSDDPRSCGIPKEHPPLSAYLGCPIYGATGLIAMVGLANRPNGFDEAVVLAIQPILKSIASILEAKHHQVALEKLAKFDELTSLYNRRSFNNQLKSLFNKKEAEDFLLLLIDLKAFNAVNDSLGHRVGDLVLQHHAKLIEQWATENDGDAFRMGGDEFSVIIPGSYDRKHAKHRAQNLQQLVAKPFEIEGDHIKVNASVGVIASQKSSLPIEQFVKYADFSLYWAKLSHDVCLLDDEMIMAYHRQVKLKLRLTKALEESLLTVEFEPIEDFKLGNVTGYEALLRWQDDEFGVIEPEEFIPLAEAMGLASVVNVYVLNYVLKNIEKISSITNNNVGVNLSPNVHNLDKHYAELSQILQQYSSALEKIDLIFEVTESSFIINNSKKILPFLEGLKSQGARLAVDDFGVEHSSLNRLLEYPFDIIKLDRCFVSELIKENSHQARSIVGAVINLANELNIDVIAEGIENKEQYDLLRSMGCDYAQGYLLNSKHAVLLA
jgi:diguanylate cyclase